MHLALIATFFLALNGCAFAGNRELYIKYTDGVNRGNDITKEVVVQNSEGYNLDLGSSDTVVATDWQPEQKVLINLTILEVGKAVTAKTFSRSEMKSVAFVAEKKPGMKKEPNFDDPCWYRVFAGKEEWVSVGWLGSSNFFVPLTIYDKIIFFVPVKSFDEPISDIQGYGVATFHENTGFFNPATMVTDRNKNTLEEKDFKHESYCAAEKLIAIQYDKDHSCTPNFRQQEAWKIYRIVGSGPFKIVRVFQVV